MPHAACPLSMRHVRMPHMREVTLRMPHAACGMRHAACEALLPYLAWTSLPCITRLHKTRLRRSIIPQTEARNSHRRFGVVGGLADDEFRTKTGPRRVFGKRPPAPRKRGRGTPGRSFAGAHGDGGGNNFPMGGSEKKTVGVFDEQTTPRHISMQLHAASESASQEQEERSEVVCLLHCACCPLAPCGVVVVGFL